MDKIIIKKLKVYGKHGCFAFERNEIRAFELNITLYLNLKKASKSDDLNDTIDYPMVMNLSQEVFSGESVNLIEKLADLLAQKLFENFDVLEKLKIKVKKLGVDVGHEFEEISTKIKRNKSYYIKS